MKINMVNSYDDGGSSTSNSDPDMKFKGFEFVNLENIEEVQQVDTSQISNIELSNWKTESSNEKDEFLAQVTYWF